MEHFSWYYLIPGIADGSAFPFLGEEARHEAYVVPAAWLACLIIILLAWLARRKLDRVRSAGGPEALLPDADLRPRNLMEIYTDSMLSFFEAVLGPKDTRKYFPFLAGLFLYILVSNLTGLLPGFVAPTSSMANNAAMAMVVFLVFNISGLMRNGWRYIAHMAGPLLLFAPFMFPLEVISLLVRPFALSLRLAGNMFGDHMVMSLFSGLVPIMVPVPLLGLGIFVSFIQALVFTLLTTNYIALAVAPLEEH